MTTDMFPEFRALALAIAPELADSALTILEHQPGWDCPPGAVAYALRGPSLPIRDYLIASGQWRGEWGSFLIYVPPLPSREKALGTLLHELSHLLPPKPPIADTLGETDAEAAAFQSGLFAGMLALRDRPEEYQPWRGHDCRFIRRAIHLRHRAAALGVQVPLKALSIAGERYGLSDWGDYQLALNTEPLRLSGKSFAEIERTPPPPKFAELFAGDVARHTYRTLMEVEQ